MVVVVNQFVTVNPETHFSLCGQPNWVFLAMLRSALGFFEVAKRIIEMTERLHTYLPIIRPLIIVFLRTRFND
jgi:hypothetical protein